MQIISQQQHMNTKLLSLSLFLFLSVQALAQDTQPYWYNNSISLIDQPAAVDEYSYDYDTQEEALAYYHTFTYNPQGKVTQHLQTNEGISNIYQTFRYLFTYDDQDRLVNYYHQQMTFNGFTNQREEGWVYDANNMLTERNIWSVSGGVNYINSPSYKREITRDGSGKVQNINVYQYSTFEEDFVLDEVFEYVYDVSNELDTINYSKANLTWGGRIDLREKRYDFDFYVKNYFNTDVMTYNSYSYLDVYNDQIMDVYETRDAEGRLTQRLVEYENGGDYSNHEYTYAADQHTVTTNYTKTITYFDQSGLEVKTENYQKGPADEWILEYPANSIKTRTFNANNTIDTELTENLWGDTYKKSTKYVFQYNAATGINNASAQMIQTEVFPNPNNGSFSISNWDQIAKINVITLDGSVKEIAAEEVIRLQENPGCFMLMVYYKNGNTGSVKVVVE